MGAFIYEKQLKRHTLSELVPVESFDEETHLFTLADGYLGFGFVAKPLPSGDESVTQRLNVLFSFDYPKGSFIQVMLMGSQDIRPTLDKIKQLRNTKDPALKESLNNRLKMLTEGATQAISLHAQSFVREYKVVFTIKLPLEQKNQLPKQHELSAARDLRLSFEQTLKSAGFAPQAMDAELYLRVVGQPGRACCLCPTFPCFNMATDFGFAHCRRSIGHLNVGQRKAVARPGFREFR